ncbi:serine/threonine protein kinase [Pilimelia anulata]|uniref:non-specific serine/threonine protein kinase n=1 Tax=Pilimelia anulata TaxID=53371 RepID=A0A8J3B1H1_9ACTN|nr:Stk1 family PASTA domain-containing Ser/Thr kinase [Pilimelia anulata]GGJ85302.1 serine/threonine protein kinase [Pilimelia anulata]
MDTQLADPLLGAVVDGRYRIRGRVARGGVATVYTAVDERLERTVALKIIQPARAVDPRFPARFTHEAKAIARLAHPNVVAVYDQGAYEDRPYLVMEYVRGRTLREVLAQRRRLDPAEALAVTEQVLAALAAAHRAGLVHRDVKPENILVAEAPQGGPGRLVDAVVKVADFGLARAVEASADEPDQLMATVAYVAPELVADGAADARADIYSVGIVLFEMLTGRVPYDGGQPIDVAWQHVDRDVPAPSTLVPALPTALDGLVQRATRRDRGRRFSDAAAMLAETSALRDRIGTSTAAMRSANATTMRVRVLPVVRPARARRVRPPARPGPAGLLDRGRDLVIEGSAAAVAGVRRLRERYGPVPVVAAGTVLALLLSLAGWWLFAGRYTAVPELVNLTKSEARQRADAAGLDLNFNDARHDEIVRPDSVLAQDPPAEGRIVRGGTVTLVLSLGPERYQVPNVVGMSYELAGAELSALQLPIERGPDRYHDTLPKGMVSALEPAVGATVKPGTRITVTVSKGRPPVSVPALVGKSIAEARALLGRLGLVVAEETVEGDQPAGQVLAQTPEPGTGVEKRARVALKLSDGPPSLAVPRVLDMPCRSAVQTLEGMGLQVRVRYSPDGVVRLQEPAEGTQVPARTVVTIGCL